MVDAVADEGLDGIVLNVGIGMGGGLLGTTAERLGHDVRGEPAQPLPRHARCAPAAGAKAAASCSSARSPGSSPAAASPPTTRRRPGIIGLCRHVALEGARRGVRANVIAPGLIDTPLGRVASAGRPSRERTPGAARSPGHRLGGRRGHGLPACPMTRATSPARLWRSMEVSRSSEGRVYHARHGDSVRRRHARDVATVRSRRADRRRRRDRERRSSSATRTSTGSLAIAGWPASVSRSSTSWESPTDRCATGTAA